ncbi:MAG TPA: chaperone modulator CbpM [Denitromonas sp.]|uniref:chaperone modulator CbpM n=1 Tax=Denitromonas sp. TaxID=2734609 RepID=UPI001D42B40C|nr:MerR family transcriptional regulator [Rhodocyclaceae bacterium]MCP5222526.1 MerR family transcriptional regulator [Zoogloeaceae bacterium]MCZ4304784.1 MerR family transcriptional regulator [Zoogloeaceae bacterium G21618-S1]HQU90216.1 chaperone modulator CbpM [Denitromonas sp.]HQV16343.1 chaperone modulator CbpM [Denitromonas sp.]
MSTKDSQPAQGTIVEEELHLTLLELCQATRASQEYVVTWVYEGVLEPLGQAPEDWRFTGESLRRARLACWLTRDLEINPPGVAMALDLLDEIATLQARLQRLGEP